MANFGANAQYDWQNGIVSLTLQDPFNQHFGLLGTINGQNHEFGIDKIQCLGWAFLKLDLAIPDQLETYCHGTHGINCDEAFTAIGVAFTNGFRHAVVLAGGTRMAVFHDILRRAFDWARYHVGTLHIIRPGGLYQLPALQGGGNPVRLRMAYPLLAEQESGWLWAVAELIALGGVLHDNPSRATGARFSRLFDTVVDALDTPPLSDQPARVARSLLLSGVPSFLRAYPEGMAQRYPAVQLRLYYIGGTLTQRREAFATLLQLLLKRLNTLRAFLVPALDVSQQVEAYRQMVEHVHDSQQAPLENTWFTYEVAEVLNRKLDDFPQVVVDAQAATPPHDAAWRSQQAITEHLRRAAMVSNAPASGGSQVAVGSNQAVAASRALKQQLCSSLMTMPFFGPAQADVVRLHAANPQNELPIFQRVMATRNVLLLQVMIGKVRGVADAAPLFSILEGLQPAFTRYVTHVVVMDKAPAATVGARPPHTLSFDFPEATLVRILSNERSKFVEIDWLELAASIKSAREHIPKLELARGSNLFESAENIPLLRYLQHFADVFDYQLTGAGSLSVGLDRLEQFRQNGNALPAGARADHLANVLAAWKVLLGDWFESLSHFCSPREAPQVGLMLSPYVYEIGGSFDQHLNFQNTATQSLNSMLMLNPAFGRVLGAPAAAGSGSPSKQGAGSSGGGTAGDKGEMKSHYANGNLYFGKGKSGPTYAVAPIMAKIKEVKPVHKGTFCLENYLSTQGYCSVAKHHAKCAQHKWPSAIQALREKFEHRPFRVDSKALPEE